MYPSTFRRVSYAHLFFKITWAIFFVCTAGFFVASIADLANSAA